MQRFKHILVGLDFSRASEEAFATALRLARRDGARVTAIHALRNIEPELSSRTRLAEQLSRDLALLIEEFPTNALEINHKVTLGTESPAEQVADAALELGADLVVVAPTGKGLMQRMILGSTSEAILRRAKVPVWIARAGYSRRMNRMLVGVDFSDPARRALALALSQAEADGASVDIVHTTHDPGEDRTLSVTAPDEQHRYRQIVLDEARERFDNFCDDHVPERLASGKPLHKALLLGNPSKAILLHADDIHADMIVVGRHSHGLLHELFIGSTAERLLRHTTCSILVVP